MTALPCPAAAAQEADAPLPTLLVPGLVAERGIEESLIRLLNELLLTEFSQSKEYKVIGASDIAAMLQQETQKQLMGCSDNSCFAEIAGAMGAEFVAHSNLGRVGGYYLINVKILDAASGAVVRRSSRQVEGVEQQLLTAVKDGVAEALGHEVGPEDVVVRQRIRLEPLPSRTGPILLGVLGAIGVGVGVGFGVKAKGYYSNVSNPSFIGAQQQIAPGRSAQTFANAGFALGTTAALSGLLWWLLNEKPWAEPAGAQKPPGKQPDITVWLPSGGMR